LAAIFVGERGFGPFRLLLTGGGVAALVLALVARALEPSPGSGPRYKARLVAAHAGLLLSLGCYAAARGAPAESPLLVALAWGGCLVLLSVALWPLLLFEAATGPVAHNPRYEPARVEQAWRRGVGFGLLVSLLGFLNFLAVRHDQSAALALGAQTRPSSQTLEVAEQLADPVDVRLYFERATDAADVLREYFDRLRDAAPQLRVTWLDHAVDRAQAEQDRVSANGWVAIRRGDVKETLEVGTDPRRARRRLRRFDRDFLERLIRVTTPPRVAYFTNGHGERPFDAAHDSAGRPGVKWLADTLRKLQFDVGPLGLAQGLSEAVPEEAEIVFVMGPTRPFLPAEQESLRRALLAGARILVALEPETDPLPELLDALGLTFEPVFLANDRQYAALTRTSADRRALATVDYARSPVTTNVRRQRGIPSVFLGAGRLDVLDSSPPEVRRQAVVRTADGTFEDPDADFQRGEDESSAEGTALVATVTTTGTVAEAQGRMVIYADVDVFADDLIQVVQGNLLLLRDTVLWLQRRSRPVVAVDADPDVKLVHRRDEDVAVFYGTTFGLPLALVAVGWWVQRRRRR
jgi:hypothetical protein